MRFSDSHAYYNLCNEGDSISETCRERSAIYKSDFHSLNYHFDGVREKNDEILDVALS